MENLIHKIFLNECYLCEETGNVICTNCLDRLKEFPENSKYRFSLFQYCDLAKRILQISKYPPYYFYLLKFLANYYFDHFQFNQEFFNSSDKTILCPVPLHPLKLYERRFNQAEIISLEIEKRFKIASYNVLKRTKNTQPLFDLSKSLRQKELKNAFQVNLLFQLIKLTKIERVILVDDLMTTKQTFLTAKKVLLQNGVKRVDFLSLFQKI